MNNISKKMLGEVVVFINGDRGVNYPKTKDYVPKGIPFFSASDLEGRTVNLSNAKFISNEAYERLRNGKINEGDILFCLRGSLGNIGLAKNIKKGAIASSLVIIRPTKEIEKDYLYYILSGPINRKIVRELDNGSVQGNLSVNELKKVEINLPNLENQKAIAHILRTLDKKIILNKKINENLEEIAKALFKSWFIDFDPVIAKAEGRSTGLPDEISDLFPNSFEDSELGRIPTGWEISNISEISEVIDCLHSKKPEREDQGHLLLQLNNITDNGILDISDKYLIKNNDYEKWTSRMETRAGDCVITNVGRVGAVSQIPPKVKAALGRNMTAIRAKNVFPFPTFILEYLLSTLGRNEIRLNIDVGTILNALNVKSIPKLRFIYPGIDLCRHYEHLSRPFREKMERIHNENESISLVRNAILPKLVSGELRIPDTEKMLEEVGI